jgi:hypothetical protein
LDKEDSASWSSEEKEDAEHAKILNGEIIFLGVDVGIIMGLLSIRRIPSVSFQYLLQWLSVTALDGKGFSLLLDVIVVVVKMD